MGQIPVHLSNTFQHVTHGMNNLQTIATQMRPKIISWHRPGFYVKIEDSCRRKDICKSPAPPVVTIVR
jgi:hypothetical protein